MASSSQSRHGMSEDKSKDIVSGADKESSEVADNVYTHGVIYCYELVLSKQEDNSWQLKCGGRDVDLPSDVQHSENVELDTSQGYLTTDDGEFYKLHVNDGCVVVELMGDLGNEIEVKVEGTEEDKQSDLEEAPVFSESPDMTSSTNRSDNQDKSNKGSDTNSGRGERQSSPHSSSGLPTFVQQQSGKQQAQQASTCISSEDPLVVPYSSSKGNNNYRHDVEEKPPCDKASNFTGNSENTQPTDPHRNEPETVVQMSDDKPDAPPECIRTSSVDGIYANEPQQANEQTAKVQPMQHGSPDTADSDIASSRKPMPAPRKALGKKSKSPGSSDMGGQEVDKGPFKQVGEGNENNTGGDIPIIENNETEEQPSQSKPPQPQPRVRGGQENHQEYPKQGNEKTAGAIAKMSNGLTQVQPSGPKQPLPDERGDDVQEGDEKPFKQGGETNENKTGGAIPKKRNDHQQVQTSKSKPPQPRDRGGEEPSKQVGEGIENNIGATPKIRNDRPQGQTSQFKQSQPRNRSDDGQENDKEHSRQLGEGNENNTGATPKSRNDGPPLQISKSNQPQRRDRVHNGQEDDKVKLVQAGNQNNDKSSRMDKPLVPGMTGITGQDSPRGTVPKNSKDEATDSGHDGVLVKEHKGQCLTKSQGDAPIVPGIEMDVDNRTSDGSPPVVPHREHRNVKTPTKIQKEQDSHLGNQDGDSATSSVQSSNHGINQGLNEEYELHVAVKYQKGKQFNIDASTTCDLDKYMRWQYVLGNQRLFKEKSDKLEERNIASIAIEKEDDGKWLVIDKGREKLTESMLSPLRHSVTEEILLGTADLMVNSFPTSGVDKHEVAKVMLERSTQEFEQELWLYADEETDFIHCVYPQQRAKQFDNAIKDIIDMINPYEVVLELPLVYSKVMDHFKVKQEVRKRYEDQVAIPIDNLESKYRCRVTIKGRMPDVKAVERWITETFIDKFSVNDISFDDIKKLDSGHNVEQIVRDCTSQPDYKDVFWYVNDTMRRIGVCSQTVGHRDKLCNLLKNCLKKMEWPLEDHQRLVDTIEVMEGRAVVKKQGNSVEVIGTKTALDSIKQDIENWKSKESQSQSSDHEWNQKNRDRMMQQSSTKEKEDERKKDNQYGGSAMGIENKKMQQKTSFPVFDSDVFKMLYASSDLRSVAAQYHVTLEKFQQGSRQVFFLTGEPSNCVKVKEKLTQLMDDHKKKGMSVIKEHYWDIQNGDRVTVRLSLEGLDDVDITISADKVQPDEAKFDTSKLLHLPKWNDGENKEKEITRNCVKNFLTFCSDKNFYKIKIEVAHLDKKIAQQFIYGISEALSKDIKRAPLQLYLCTDNTDMYEQLVDFCHKTMQTTEPSCHPSVSPQPVRPPPLDPPPEGQERPRDRLQITIIRGTLNGTKADVLVNTTGRDLNLDVGNVSKALLKSAGPQLQQEVKKKFPNGIKYGEIVVTPGYNLQGCQYVLHGALDAYSSVGNVTSLQQFVGDCLVEADHLHCQTIAFPAIGTGNLSYPKHVVAKAMFDAVRQFDGRQKHLTEVMFVIFHQDKETIAEFEKQDGQQTTNISREHGKEIVYIGKIGVTIKYRSVKDITDSGIIYIWERSSSYNVRILDHDLLKHVGQEVRNLWTTHRNDKENRDKPLVTPGGLLPVDCIIHVFCQEDIHHLREALLTGLRKADTLPSVTLFFNRESKFLKFGSGLTDAFIQSIQTIQNENSKIQTVCMMIDQKVIAEKFWNKLQKKFSLAELSGRSQTQKPANQDKNQQMVEESHSPSIERGDANVDIVNQVTAWKKVKDTSLHKSDKMQHYLLVQEIQGEFSETTLEKKFQGIFGNSRFQLIYIPRREEALLLFKTKEDAKSTLENFWDKLQFCRLKDIPTQSVEHYTVELEHGETAESSATDILEKKGIDVLKARQKAKTQIKAPTKYQTDYALFKLSERGQQERQREKKDSQGFDYIVSSKCTQDVWDIVKVMKAKDLNELKRQGNEVTFENGTVTAMGVKADGDFSCIDVVKSYIMSMSAMQIVEVPVNGKRDKTDSEILRWCKEIEERQQKQCCTYVKKRICIFVYSDKYDEIEVIKHQILVKDGQRIVRGRRKDRELTGGEIQEDNTYDSLPAQSNVRNPEAKRRHVFKPEFALERQAKNLKEYTTDENIKVYVYEANILKLPVDCIVNAANENLQHGGGVARVIAQAAGRRLDLEGFDYIRKYGNIPVGQTCTTTAGNLHYDCVIHTVGPCWSNYYPHSLEDVKQCEKDLYSAIMESFLAAEARDLESVALPAISAAIFAVPQELCVYHYAKATLDYSQKMSRKALKEIHFIDINPNIVKSIQRMFTTMLGQRGNLNYFTEKYVKTWPTMQTREINSTEAFQRGINSYETPLSGNRAQPNHQRDLKSDGKEGRSKHAGVKVVPVYYKERENHVFESERCKLNLQQGDIMKVPVAAIVSVEDKQGQGKGRIAKLIYDKIAYWNQNNFQRDKKYLFNSHTEEGDVYVTEGYDTGYKYILHVVVPYEIRNYPPKDRIATIRKTVTNLLKTLDDESIDSVVTCLIGSGTESRDDVRIVAGAFIQAYTDYCQKGKRHPPLHITLVCWKREVLQNVVQKFNESLKESSNVRPPVLPPRPGNLPMGHSNKDSENLETPGDCVICMEKITDKKVLKCGHAFDKDCIDQQFEVKKVCPTCGAICGELKGDQPEGNIFCKTESWNHCEGFDSYGRISITYTFPGGCQGSDHPNPGKWYNGITRTAYLPDNVDGREILEMLKIAFKRKLTFTIGTSRTTGEEGVITWNDIHHKTDHRPNTQFGYPDPTYLDRVRDELAAKGITSKDIPRK